jgi:surface protein
MSTDYLTELDLSSFDTSKVTTMYEMFAFSELQNVNVASFDTSNVTDTGSMFRGCESLQIVPLFDTSNVTNMGYMFYGRKQLTTIPAFDTSKVTSFSDMFNSATNIISIPLLDCSKVYYGSNINLFASSTMTYLTDLGGFKDLGKVSGFNKPSYFLKNCPNLTKESVLNVLNNLYDRKTAGYSVVTLPFHTNALALLSDEEKAIATNKGWTIS